jgi:alpha-L-rhamnosidase
LIIQPHPTKKLGYSKATFESSYGTVASGWERKDGKTFVKVQIPVNTTATIILPAGSQDKVTEGGNSPFDNENLKDVKFADSKFTMKAGSGSYTFEIAE